MPEVTEAGEHSSENHLSKTRYFSDFAKKHLSTFRPHLAAESLGHKKNPEIWRSVSEHCLVAGVAADILAEQFKLDPVARSDIVRAALLHDWNKKHEQITFRKALGDTGELNLETVEGTHAEDAEALREMGISENVIALTNANVPKDENGPDTDAERIIWYVDAMLSGTDLVSIRRRLDNTRAGFNGTEITPDQAIRNIAFSEAFKKKYGGRSIFDIQEEVETKLTPYFAKKLGVKGSLEDQREKIPLLVKALLDERIQNH